MAFRTLKRGISYSMGHMGDLSFANVGAYFALAAENMSPSFVNWERSLSQLLCVHLDPISTNIAKFCQIS